MATEQRLIDANKIPWEEWYVPDSESEEQWDFKAELGVLKPAIDKMPTVDAVEVVRCKDCARYKKGYCTIRKDSWGAALLVGEHDFCSDGERKE